MDGQDPVKIGACLGDDVLARADLSGGAAYHGGKIAVHLCGISRRAYLRHGLGRHGTVLGYEVAKEAPPAAIGPRVVQYRGDGALVPAGVLLVQQLVEHQVGALQLVKVLQVGKGKLEAIYVEFLGRAVTEDVQRREHPAAARALLVRYAQAIQLDLGGGVEGRNAVAV